MSANLPPPSAANGGFAAVWASQHKMLPKSKSTLKSQKIFLLTGINHSLYISDQMISGRRALELDAADIAELLVGITPIYLQNFVSRGLHGLRASVKPRTQRRLFSRADVFGIGLVWLLCESGLRRDPIDKILSDIARTKKPNANLAAKKLLESQAEYVVIVRQPRGPTKTPAKNPVQETKIVSHSEWRKIRAQNPTGVEMVIPVGHKFRDIEKRLELLFPSQGA
jgi:hypothetical protein